MCRTYYRICNEQIKKRKINMPRKLAKETSKGIKSIGGRETPNSGATFWGEKNDGIRDLTFCWGAYNGVSIESKFTEARSFSVTLEILNKCIQDAKGKLPVLLTGLINPQTRVQYEFVTMKASDFKEIMDWIEFLQNNKVEN